MATRVQELDEQARTLTYDRNNRALYREQQNELRDELKDLLAAEYASDLNQAQTDLIFRKAWDDGHSGGYVEVEGAYVDLADLISEIIKAGR